MQGGGGVQMNQIFMKSEQVDQLMLYVLSTYTKHNSYIIYIHI